ncbi:hypothetical protein J6590_055267 [Homalodisca vitripennis]|nr:hypothetical protein J6590_055267 [Homalodisca vitripennis]
MCLHGQPWSWYACKHAAPQLSGRGLTDFWFTMYQVITSKTAPVCLLVSTTCVCTASRGRGTHYYMCLHGQPWSWYACKQAAPQLSGRGLTDFWFTMYQVIASKTAPVCLLDSTTCVCTAGRSRGTQSGKHTAP